MKYLRISGAILATGIAIGEIWFTFWLAHFAVAMSNYSRIHLFDIVTIALALVLPFSVMKIWTMALNPTINVSLYWKLALAWSFILLPIVFFWGHAGGFPSVVFNLK